MYLPTRNIACILSPPGQTSTISIENFSGHSNYQL